MTQLVSLAFILWKVIYLVDNTFQRLNNRGLNSNVNSTCKFLCFSTGRIWKIFAQTSKQ